MADEIMTEGQVAAFLQLRVPTLREMRRTGRGPKFSKWGDADRSPVRYFRDDVRAWAADPAGHELEVWGRATTRSGPRPEKPKAPRRAKR